MSVVAKWTADDKPTANTDAIEWFRKRVPMTDPEYRELEQRARVKAFWVANVAKADVVNDVMQALDKAIADGTDFAEFKKSVADKLQSAWGDSVANPGDRLDTIYRTNVQSAYGAGRYVQMHDPAVIAIRPFAQLDTVKDSRQSPICRALSSPPLDSPIVVPQDDPFVDSHVTPLHHRCRTNWRALRRSQAEATGVTKNPPDVHAAPGFGKPPGQDEWNPRTPDPKNEPTYPPEIQKELQKKLDATHDPAFWLDSYKHLGDAASTTAHGRAALERGLDGDLADVVAAVNAAHPRQAVFVDELIRYIKPDIKRAGPVNNLREMIGALGEDDSRVDHLRALAAMGGHIRALTPAATPPTATPQWPSGKAEKADAKEILAEVQKFFHAMIDAKVSGGSPKIRWSTERAGASGSNIRTDYDTGTLVHEWAHVLDLANADVLAKHAIAFREQRTQGEKNQFLSVIFPKAGYRDDEVTKKDKFADPYVGKIYKELPYGSEITSMGVQWLFEQPGLFFRQDQEHFLLALGQLAGA